MMLVTGATGFVGRAVVNRLARASPGHVRAAVRKPEGIPSPEVEWVVVPDLSGNTDWSEALAGVDVVIHGAARVHVMRETAADPLGEFRRVNVDGTLCLAQEAAARNTRRFVFISSIKVNGDETRAGKPFTETDAPAPGDFYGVSKHEAERSLFALGAATGMEIVVIRPVLVYGPGVKGSFRSMLRWIARGIPLPLGAIRNKRSLVALENLVDLIVVCTTHPAAANQIFLVSDGDDLSTTELLRRVGRVLGRPARLLPVPAVCVSAAGMLLGKRDVTRRLLGSLQVDISKARTVLGWKPPVSVEDGLRSAAGL